METIPGTTRLHFLGGGGGRRGGGERCLHSITLERLVAVPATTLVCKFLDEQNSWHSLRAVLLQTNKAK